MKNMSSRWRDDAGSLDFIQIVVGLLIVAIASVGTFQALNFGNDKLNQQMRYRKAISIARSHVEYWQGRIHTGDFSLSDPLVRNGNLVGRIDETILDEGNPDDPDDDVMCEVRHGPIGWKDIDETGDGIDYYIINVKVTWWEPGQRTFEPNMVKFNGTMVSAAL